MALIIKQSTAQDILLGPFVDESDGKTAETGFTIEDEHVLLFKQDTGTYDSFAAKNESTNCTHRANGYYTCPLDATDTNTVGQLIVTCSFSGGLPVRHEFQVVEEAIYDTMYVSGADLETKIDAIDTVVDAILVDTGTTLDGIVDAILVDTSTTLDTKLNDIQGSSFSSGTDSLEAIRDRGDSAWTGSMPTSHSGTAQGGSSTTLQLAASGASGSDDTYNGQLIYISSGTGAGQSRAIASDPGYVASGTTATIIGTWATAPDNTSVYAIYPSDIDEFTAAPVVGDIANAVWDEATSGHTTSGTFGEQCKNDIDAILTDTGTTLDSAIGVVDGNVDLILADTAEMQGDLANGGRLDLLVDAILADTATLGAPAGASHAADIAALKAETAAILVDTGTTLDGEISTIDTVVDAIKVQTDKLAFTVTNQVDANIQSINDVTIAGDGDGTPFNV